MKTDDFENFLDSLESAFGETGDENVALDILDNCLTSPPKQALKQARDRIPNYVTSRLASRYLRQRKEVRERNNQPVEVIRDSDIELADFL